MHDYTFRGLTNLKLVFMKSFLHFMRLHSKNFHIEFLTFEFKRYKLHFFLILAHCERPAHILLTLTRPNKKKKFSSIFLHVVIWTWRRQSQRKTKLEEDLPIFISRYDIFTEKKTFFFIYLYISSLEPCSWAKYLLCT